MASPASGKVYTGFVKIGWNATTFATEKSKSRQLNKPTDITRIFDIHPSIKHTAFPEKRPTGAAYAHLNGRHVDDEVVATIDDVIVSCSKNFDGATARIEGTAGFTPGKLSTIFESELTAITEWVY